jgi:hypothetical protein
MMTDQTDSGFTEEQQKALDHAREVLAVEETSSSLPDREWRRELRWALRGVVQAFPAPGTGHEPREEPTARLADSPAFNALIAHQLGDVGEGPGDETGTEFDPANDEPEYGEG